MSMDAAQLTAPLERLCQTEAEPRRRAMEELLFEMGLDPKRQEEAPGPGSPRGVVNFLVRTGETENPSLLLCAHYDAFPGSCGANDNGAALCILAALAKKFQAEGTSASFAFLDGEESGMSGSRLCASLADKASLKGVINLDLCGYGDTIVLCPRCSGKKPALRPFCGRERLKRHNAQLVPYLPPSDDISFSRAHIPALGLSVVPRWDVQYLRALAASGSGLLGKPPEFDMMLSQMEVTTTIHGGFRDKIEWVQPEAMLKVYRFLDEAVHAPQKEVGFWGRFFS